MATKESKSPQRNPITIRFTNDEVKLIEWYSDRVACDRANGPRQIIAAYFTAFPELYQTFLEETQPTNNGESNDNIS